MQVGFEIVMAVLLAKLLLQAQPEPPVLRIHVFDAHADRSTNAREGIDHEADERPIAEADDGRGIDRVEKLTRLGRIEHRRLAAPHRATHGGGQKTCLVFHKYPIRTCSHKAGVARARRLEQEHPNGGFSAIGTIIYAGRVCHWDYHLCTIV